jgi:hypothetical protein
MRTPQRFLSMLTKNQLAEMIAPTYALLATVDPNEAYTSLEPALKDVDLISSLQGAVWNALQKEKGGGAPSDAILDAVSKKLSKPRKFRAAKVTGKDEGAWIAMGLYLRLYAGTASGEAADLLETDQGQKLLDKGFELLGTHLAKELLR